ncbi:MAG: cytidylate kinase family protein [Alphaproteobacteria bacterium]|nr:cytidylate kinase family protein [Alphaproteobacteria bacterium]
MSQSRYYRIAITGDPGSGKSTFARAVSELTGFRLITTGNIFRTLAAEKGISLTALNEMAESQAEIDHLVDDFLKTLNDQKEHLILDSRMAWFFVKDALKIRLTVDLDVAVHRIFSDGAELREKFTDIQTAMDEVERRRRSEIIRYKSLYGVDIGDPANFDLVINTSQKAPLDVTREFEQAFAVYKKQYDHVG